MTINGLVDIVEEIAGVTLERNYQLDAPQGVRGRNSDNALIKETYGVASPQSLSAKDWRKPMLGFPTRSSIS